MTIVVYGIPAPQGSKRHVGGGRMIESSKALKPWREAVKYAALERSEPRILGPVNVEMTFTVCKPKSAPKRRVSYPDKKPDLSKLIRSTEDALTDAGVWEDDARVISCVARKVFPAEHPNSLNTPGAVIHITSAATDINNRLLRTDVPLYAPTVLTGGSPV